MATVSQKTTRLLRSLQQVLSWVDQQGMDQVFVASPSWRSLRAAQSHIPENASVRHKALLGGRVAVRSKRIYGASAMMEARWPKDKLHSIRTPKLCFVLAGKMAVQLADYVLHCGPGHGYLVPPGTPFPDGSESLLDTSLSPHGFYEEFGLVS